jgi:alginate O-acetyltransferase complex protein AlgJ
VKRGEGNWLFLDEELQLHRDRTAHAAARATAVADIARALAGRHIALLVVVVPDKSRIESTHLGTLRRAPALDARVRDWTAKLDASGVATLDLAPVLSGSPASSFLHTDTHWNERGSSLAAHAVAQRLQQMHALQGDPVPSVVVSKQDRQVWGDLLHLAGIDGLPASLQPAPDTDTQSVVETRNESTDLFGATAVPSTVLIGTSFSRRSNFLPFLQLASRALVADFAMDGGDFSGAARRYFAGEAFAKTRRAPSSGKCPNAPSRRPSARRKRGGCASRSHRWHHAEPGGSAHVAQVPHVGAHRRAVAAMQRQAHQQFQPAAQRKQQLDRVVRHLLGFAAVGHVGVGPQRAVGLARPRGLACLGGGVEGDDELGRRAARAGQFVPAARSVRRHRDARAVQRTDGRGMKLAGHMAVLSAGRRREPLRVEVREARLGKDAAQ